MLQNLKDLHRIRRCRHDGTGILPRFLSPCAGEISLVRTRIREWSRIPSGSWQTDPYVARSLKILGIKSSVWLTPAGGCFEAATRCALINPF